MPAQCGSAALLKIKDDATTPAFQTIGGLRMQRVAFGAEMVDVTNASSPSMWREVLDNCGVKSSTLSGEGLFFDDTAQNEVQDAFFKGQIRDMEFTVPGFGVLAGKYKCTAFELGAPYNESVTFSATFESAGAITFTSS